MKTINELVEQLLDVKNHAEMRDFLVGLFTPKELDKLMTRLKIVKLLKKGLSQHKIAEKLKVGVATVTRGSREIKNGRFSNV
jgi:TrpR family transcriptional regulator, trp operon repressor